MRALNTKTQFTQCIYHICLQICAVFFTDANSDPDLCSGRPVNGLTTLRNGTIVVFRGQYKMST